MSSKQPTAPQSPRGKPPKSPKSPRVRFSNEKSWDRSSGGQRNDASLPGWDRSPPTRSPATSASIAIAAGSAGQTLSHLDVDGQTLISARQQLSTLVGLPLHISNDQEESPEGSESGEKDPMGSLHDFLTTAQVASGAPAPESTDEKKKESDQSPVVSMAKTARVTQKARVKLLKKFGKKKPVPVPREKRIENARQDYHLARQSTLKFGTNAQEELVRWHEEGFLQPELKTVQRTDSRLPPDPSRKAVRAVDSEGFSGEPVELPMAAMIEAPRVLVELNKGIPSYIEKMTAESGMCKCCNPSGFGAVCHKETLTCAFNNTCLLSLFPGSGCERTKHPGGRCARLLGRQTCAAISVLRS